MIKLEHNGVILYIEGMTYNNTNYLYRGESISVYVDASNGIDFAGFVCLNINNVNLATYLCDSQGKVRFEMNYALRNITANSLVSIIIHDVNAWGIQFQAIVKDGVSIKNTVHPLPKELMNSLGTYFSSSYRDMIIPPNVIYKLSPYPFSTPSNQYIPPICFESTIGFNRVWGALDVNIPADSTYPDSYIINEQTDYIHLDTKTADYKIPFRELDDCDNVAIVRWISSFGNLRQHIFRVRDITDSAYESTSLITGTNGLKDIRNIQNSIVLFIDGLTEYSLWYYSDLLLSKEIHSTVYKEECMLNPISGYLDTLSLDNTLSEVDNKEITYNPSTQFYTLELTLNKKQFRRY